MEIRVPHIAEGIESGTVVRILVKEGDEVANNQDVIELETKKAVAPIAATGSGKVQKIHVKEGDEVSIGSLLVTLGQGAGVPAAAAATAAPKAQAPKPSYNPPPQPAPSYEAKAPQGNGVHFEPYQYQSPSGFEPPASPTIRKVARELGIDLNRVRGTEHGGRITMDDVRAYIEGLQRNAFERRPMPTESPKPAGPAPLTIDFSKWGAIKKEPAAPTRKTIAQRMLESWTTIPHVTQFDDADITALSELRKKYAPAYEKKGAKLTLTAFILKALVPNLKKYPVFNSSFNMAANEIIYKNYISIGIAVDTESGLVVPVLRDIDKKDLFEISQSLNALADRTRKRKNTIDEFQGGTFTISNQGGIGGTHFTPIINAPEVAILGIGQGITRVVLEKKAENRTFLPLGLSYDHRVIDGGTAVRFITDLKKSLEEFSEKEVKL